MFIAKCRICIGFVPAIKVGMRSHDMMACPTWRPTFKRVHVTPGLHVIAGNPAIDSEQAPARFKNQVPAENNPSSEKQPTRKWRYNSYHSHVSPWNFCEVKVDKQNTFPCHVHLFFCFTSICSRFWPILQSLLGGCLVGNKSSSQFDEYIPTDLMRCMMYKNASQILNGVACSEGWRAVG